ncbi:single-stranded-DNA-specific exonuclease RecJ [Pseudofulvibacter geojedonensis]|uniref:Single-stranded-DNA-specific exonuclease RecJ n=1 Tax=Pseudofulvibacter geojedonensis TaxID=1123758 RepID=A0ABW3I095_9FLAO
MRWIIKPIPEKQQVIHLQEVLGVDAIIATLLVQRGINTFEEAKAFFRPSLEDLHDPYLMKDMDKAVARIEKAIINNENILVYGDYDVDGTTAVSLVASYLKTYYPQVATYIPDRYAEGYGVSYQGIDYAHDNDISLIIALDCGIKAIDKIAYAQEKGVDFIICDHHRPGKELPKAVAVLDPKREDCSYPYDELSGCGVGFKLIQAIGKNRNQTIEDFIPYLDLVATSIAADIVPITGENRVLAYHGLQLINSKPRIGIKVFTKALKKTKLSITDVVFQIAPRINAAGRIKHGNHAVSLLTELDYNTAVDFAVDIDNYNTERKALDKQITKEALDQIEANQEEDNFTTVVFKKDWHKGVIGIVASRLTETYYRPTLVFTQSGDKLAASARSVRGFDVYEALDKCSEHIEQFGGHKYAAGLTLLPEQYEAFKTKFEQVVRDNIDKKLLTPELVVDASLDLNQITPKFYRLLKQLGPFGPQNPNPVFISDNLQDTGHGKCVGEDQTHLRFTVKQQNSNQYVGIGFGLGDKLPIISNKNPFKAAYHLDENEWQGNVSLQLMVKDIK